MARRKLKELRFDRGLTQLDLFLKTGVSTARISMIENQKLIPSDEERVKLAEALGVEAGEVGWPEIREAS